MGLFDGVAGLMADVFGDPIPYRPRIGAERIIQSVFRVQPLEALGEDGPGVIISQPTWRVRADLIGDWGEGDEILAPDGRRYRLRHMLPSASPAADANLLFILEEAE